jgi:hypothetical protein
MIGCVVCFDSDFERYAILWCKYIKYFSKYYIIVFFFIYLTIFNILNYLKACITNTSKS